jgi:hypothetical protein
MDSIGDLLDSFKHDEPPEVAILKQYISDAFDAPAAITVQETTIIITVRSAALANALRLRTTALRGACDTTKRLVFRIG